jgi:hypothetical protein
MQKCLPIWAPVEVEKLETQVAGWEDGSEIFNNFDIILSKKYVKISRYPYDKIMYMLNYKFSLVCFDIFIKVHINYLFIHYWL